MALKIIHIRNAKKPNIRSQTASIVARRDISLGNVQPIKKAFTKKEDLALDVDQLGIFLKIAQTESGKEQLKQ